MTQTQFLSLSSSLSSDEVAARILATARWLNLSASFFCLSLVAAVGCSLVLTSQAILNALTNPEGLFACFIYLLIWTLMTAAECLAVAAFVILAVAMRTISNGPGAIIQWGTAVSFFYLSKLQTKAKQAIGGSLVVAWLACLAMHPRQMDQSSRKWWLTLFVSVFSRLASCCNEASTAQQ